MNRLMKGVVAFLAAAVMSGSALAAIVYFENFEGLDAESPSALSDAGWLVFANVWEVPTSDGCAGNYFYGYGSFPAPNGGPGFSSLVTGTSTGQALNVYSDYNNGDHGNGFCIEANVFQEQIFDGADAGDYEFIFNVKTPGSLGDLVTTYGFIKVLDPNAGFATVLFEKVDTEALGNRTLPVTLGSEYDGMILQWGFASTATQYQDTGRWYDNLSFGLEGTRPEGVDPGLAIPTMDLRGLLLLMALVGGLGLAVLARRT